MKSFVTMMLGLLVATPVALAAPAVAEPDAPEPTPVTVTLASLTYDGSEVSAYPTGRLTGVPVTGGPALTFRPALFAPEAYLKSDGFGEAPPDSVVQWDQAVDKLSVTLETPTPPPPFAVIGNTRDMAELATKLPAGTVVVSYVPDTYYPGYFTTTVIQPVAR